MKDVTFEDIARELKISKGLVSLAMRNKYGVSDEMRSKIVLKAAEMGYEFEIKSLKKVKNISLLIKKMDVLKEEFWRHIMYGIEQAAASKNIMLNVVSWSNGIKEKDVAMNLHDINSQGVILLNQCPESIIKNIQEFNIPLVLLDMTRPNDGDFDQVMANNYGGGLRAIKYLIEKGHKNIIIFGNKNYSYSFLQRFYGCQDGVTRACTDGVQINYLVLSSATEKTNNNEFYEDDDHIICNPEDLSKYLKSDSRYTAIVCLNDMVLKFATEAIARANLKIPEDISVISFDNTSIAKSMNPTITSISIPKREMGENAVKLLLDKIKQTRIASATLELNTSLVERESVKDLNTKKVENIKV